MANQDTGEPLNQLSFIHFIDLPKLTREALNGTDRSARWGLIVKEFRDIDLMEEIEMQTSAVQEVFSRLGNMSLSKIAKSYGNNIREHAQMSKANSRFK